MRKICALALFAPIFCQGQIDFSLVLPLSPLPIISAEFDGVEYGSTVAGDVDNDGDQDVLFTGFNGNSRVANLYMNDGLGNYSIQSGTPFDGVRDGDTKFADINGDTHIDVIITGLNNTNLRIAKIYINNGLGGFIEQVTTINGVDNSDIALNDIDNDTDLDLVITGYNGTARITKLYLNNGSGNFSIVAGTPFDGVEYGDFIFGDVDNDGDDDALLTGLTSASIRIAKLYLNNGFGVFTYNPTPIFAGVYYSAAAFEDIDNDNDLDVIIAGRDITSAFITRMYSNDGFGNFTLTLGSTFVGVKNVDVAFADIDGDADKDLIYSGYDNSNNDVTLLYENDGNGNFSEIINTPFYKSSTSGIAFADIDNDTDLDVFIAGRISINERVATLYENDGNGNFQVVTENVFNGVGQGEGVFADFNGDTTEDLLLVGERHPSSFRPSTRIYSNNGFGVFSYVPTPVILPLKWGSVAAADVDNDLDIDLVLAGQTIINVPTTKLYLNDGFGNFTENTSVPFDSVYWSDVEFADIDGDLDKDLLIVGRDPDLIRQAKLYTNDSLGNFTEVLGTPFVAVYWGSIDFADIDADNDLDVMITGYSNSGPSSKLYTNDGLGIFTEVIGTPFPQVHSGDVDFADVNGDNSLDLVITGFPKVSKLFLNDGLGNFSESPETFVYVSKSGVDFSDVDGDGDQDLLIVGEDNLSANQAILYQNNGLGNFTQVTSMPFTGTEDGSVLFGNVNGDNKPDVLITGELAPAPLSLLPISKLYMNNTCIAATSIDNQISCGPYTWIDGNTYTSDTINAYHTIVGGALSGCDSIITLHLILNNTASSDTLTACDSLNWMDGNTYYSSNNLSTYSLPNSLGCDSIIQLELTVNYSNSVIDVISNCDSLLWIDGITYSASNNSATYLMTNAYGCDSLITLNLFVNQNDTVTNLITSCDSLTWLDGNTYTTSNNSATHILTSAFGCDSLVQLDLTLNYATFSSDAVFACDSYTWINGNVYTASNNSDSYLLTNTVGCDSLISLNLVIYQTDTVVDLITACDAATWIDGVTYTANNNSATHLLSNSFGCDSLVQLDLTINYASFSTDIITACDSYSWIDGNEYFTNNNSATHILTNSYGCDSTVTLDLTFTVVDATTSLNNYTITASDLANSYQWLDCNNNYATILGEFGQSFTPIIDGDYAVLITQNSCQDTSDCVSVQGLSLEEELLNSVLITPNPSNGLINIQFGELTNAYISIYNPLGELIYETNQINPSDSVDITLEGSNGIYLVKILIGSTWKNYKVVKGD